MNPSVESIAQRYISAARFTAPKMAGLLPGVVEGYWVDDDLFFFLAETFDEKVQSLIDVPTLASIRANKVEPVIPLPRLRELLEAHTGNTFDVYALSSADMVDRDTLAIAISGQDFLIDRQALKIKGRFTSDEAPSLYSPDRRYACFIRGHDLWLKDLQAGSARRLTSDGVQHHAYGQESQTALSAVSYQKHPYPVGLWSPDSQWFLTHRIDERDLPELSLIQHCPPDKDRPQLHQFKYPFPGDPLPQATLVAIHASTGRVVSFDQWPMPIMIFSPFFTRTTWFGDAGVVWFIRANRYCDQVELIRMDLERQEARCVLREEVKSGYIDLHPLMARTPNVRTLSRSEEIIWFSERDGWGHLYLHDAKTGALKNRITSGEWLARDVVHVDEEQRRVWFLAGGMDSKVDPARRSLCVVNLDGTGLQVLLKHEGDIFVPRTEPGGIDQHRRFRPSYSRAGFSPDGQHTVVQFTSVKCGNRTEIRDLKMQRSLSLGVVEPLPDEPGRRTFSALAADGVTELYGVLFFPSDFDERRRYPLIDYIYPGPHVTHQPQAYGAVDSGPAVALAEVGFITLMLDTRGMPLSSRAHHQIGYGSFVEPQLADHAAVVRELCQRHTYLDTERVGMMGYSSGGLATVRALCDYPEVFKAGVAACGNYDSMAYCASWSEKYRGAGDHSEQAAETAVDRLRGRLLLIAGDMDENVHVSQTFALIGALVRANKNFDLLIVPNEGHSVLTTNGYVQRRAWDFFVRELLGVATPDDFLLEFSARELHRLATKWLREIRR